MAEESTGSERFERTWKPLTGFALVVGFGVQPALPYVNPTIVMLFVLCAGMFYFMSYSNFHGLAKHSEVRAFLGLLIGFGAIAAFTCGIFQFSLTLNELAAPCQKMRLQLIAKPDSTLSDTYSALHCPAVMPLEWPWDRWEK
ncbi:hypothetical protein [Novosphingobium lindaniclasticum]|uniref:hypothetical protein n=1 Tax=Novosphingobium lindaniclasticum TaxID=1329895 RepID=UPI00126795F8|nr:hypothetical protein [Novosphingobium lindaniclasticum]